jgi:hypothetical protein
MVRRFGPGDLERVGIIRVRLGVQLTEDKH